MPSVNLKRNVKCGNLKLGKAHSSTFVFDPLQVNDPKPEAHRKYAMKLPSLAIFPFQWCNWVHNRWNPQVRNDSHDKDEWSVENHVGEKPFNDILFVAFLVFHSRVNAQFRSRKSSCPSENDLVRPLSLSLSLTVLFILFLQVLGRIGFSISLGHKTRTGALQRLFWNRNGIAARAAVFIVTLNLRL